MSTTNTRQLVASPELTAAFSQVLNAANELRSEIAVHSGFRSGRPFTPEPAPSLPAAEKPKASAALTADDFKSNSQESQARIAAAMDRYVAENGLSGPGAYMRAFNALAAQCGVRPVMATPGYDGGTYVGNDGDDAA